MSAVFSDTNINVAVAQTGNNVSSYEITMSSDQLNAFFSAGDISGLQGYVYEVLANLLETFTVDLVSVEDGNSAEILHWEFVEVVTVFEDPIELNEITAPATPAAGRYVIYHDEADSKLKGKDNTGLINEL
jgi:hypothetical protein